MIRFVTPEAFLLLPVAVLLLRWRLWPRPFVGTLRALVLIAVVALLAGPYVPGEADGRDVVLVLDRSRSMPANTDAAAQELVDQVVARLQPGDRIGHVAFGRKPTVEQLPGPPWQQLSVTRTLDPDGSDLAAAIDAALATIPPGRHGSLLLLSDGEPTGGDVEAAARAALRAGLRIDAVHLPGSATEGAAIEDVMAPGDAALREPFALSAFVWASVAGKGRYRLLRGDAVVGEGDVELQPGRNLLQFRQALPEPGVQVFTVEIKVDGDRSPANDRGQVAVRAVAPARVLCVTPGGRDDRLTRSLRAAGLEVVNAAPAGAPLQLDQLDGFRVVILEDVAAGDLPSSALPALQTWVRHLGGGLLMTGGRAAFGVGGYHRSAVEDVLPVTLEMRDEQRRFGLAMAIALDRSGSMQAPAGDGTKMDLANRGTATAVELLSAIDAVSVIAVDSGPHVVVPMTQVRDKAAISGQVRAIESGGGGIYVGAALEAAAVELGKATQQNRHIVLFADAADAEEPGDYKVFVPQLVATGITVSVIGLGSKSDSDAALLEEIARLGNGRCQFVQDAADLPRVFAQETIQVAKSAMVEQPTQCRVLPALASLGGMPATLPTFGGYSLAWPRPRAELALETIDDQKAPMLAYWQCGLGRSAAFLGEADGELSGDLAGWNGYAEFFGTLTRWLAGGAAEGIWADFRRDGDVGVLALEVEDAAAPMLDRARGVVATPDGRAHDVVWQRISPTRLEARMPLLVDGVYRGAVQVGDVAVRVAPLCLPYSPEYAPRPDPRAGERLLRRIASITGGSVAPSADAIVAGPRRAPGLQDLTTLCALLAIALVLAEIAVRRLQVVLPRLRAPAWWLRRRAAAAGAAAKAEEIVPVPLPQVRFPGPSAAAPPPMAPPPAPTAPPPPPPGSGTTLDALARARRRGGRS